MTLNDIQSWITEQVTNNQFFAGAIGGSVMYTVLNYLKGWGHKIYGYIKNAFIRQITLNVAVDDDMCKQYHFFCIGFIKKPKNIKFFKKENNFRKLKTTKSGKIGTRLIKEPIDFLKNKIQISKGDILIKNEKIKSDESIGLSFGTHWFMYNWYTLVYINISDDSSNHSEYKTEVITTSFISLNPDKARLEFQQKFDDFFTEASNKPAIYSIGSYGAEKIRTVPPRTLDGIFVEDKLKEELCEKIEDFYDNVDFYSSVGISPTIGIMLYGIPGTGKSSLITAIANHFNCSIYTLDCTETNDIKIGNKMKSLMDIKPYSIITLEDLDCSKVFRKRVENEENKSLSECLKMLDGTNLPDGTIIIATTNHIDRLDPAVVRHGRFDIKLELKPACKNTAQKMIEYLNPNKLDLLDKLKFPITQAELQARILGRLN